jgi:hypothetical protein
MELILLWLVMAIICGMVASSKNRSFFLYFLGGLLFWPIVLVAAILAKPRAENRPGPFDYPAEPAKPVPALDAPFAADGMIGQNPYRRDGDAVIVLIGTTQVRFASYETARKEITGTA